MHVAGHSNAFNLGILENSESRSNKLYAMPRFLLPELKAGYVQVNWDDGDMQRAEMREI